MKKVLTLFLLLNFTILSAFADETSICSSKVAGNAFSNGLSNITGTNFILTKVAESQIQRELNKKLQTKTNVELKAFGGKSFIDGKFKSMTFEAKNANLNGTYVSKISANTLCSYNQVKLEHNDLLFLENFVMNFQGTISENDLQKSLLSDDVLAQINKISLNIGSANLFKVYSPSVSISNSKIHYAFQVSTPLLGWFTPKKISIDANVGIKNGRLELCDLTINPSNKMINLTTIEPILNLFNPFIFNLKISHSTSGTINLKYVKIIGNEIVFSGVSVIPKNKIAQR